MFESPQEYLIWLFSDKIKKKAEELWNWLWGRKKKGEKSSILIIGPGGTGKSTFGRILADQYDAILQSLGVYEESIDIETYSLKDDPSVEIIVPPGQEQRRDFTWSTLGQEISGGKFRGIVLVGAYGYHSFFGVSFKKHRLYKSGKKEFLQAFLKDRRSEEITVLNELAPFIKACNKKCWLLTLVTKQDLWWRNRAAVDNFYRIGDYGKIIKKIQRGKNTLHHEVVYTSLMIANFKTGEDELLVKTSPGYDLEKQISTWKAWFKVFENLKNWEEGK